MDLPLSPAWKYVLMAGASAPGRVPGWTDVIQENGAGNRLWAVHRAALLAEAADNAFEPYWLRSRAPSGPGFLRWADLFVEQHRYQEPHAEKTTDSETAARPWHDPAGRPALPADGRDRPGPV